MAVVYRCVGILTVDVVFFWNPGVFHSQDSFPSTFRLWLWETSSGVVTVAVFAAVALRATAVTTPECLPQPGTKCRGEGILRMEDAGTSEEDDIDSQDYNTSIDHGHLARNCSIKIITPAVKASVISINMQFLPNLVNYAPRDLAFHSQAWRISFIHCPGNLCTVRLKKYSLQKQNLIAMRRVGTSQRII